MYFDPMSVARKQLVQILLRVDQNSDMPKTHRADIMGINEKTLRDRHREDGSPYPTHWLLGQDPLCLEILSEINCHVAALNTEDLNGTHEDEFLENARLEGLALDAIQKGDLYAARRLLDRAIAQLARAQLELL